MGLGGLSRVSCCWEVGSQQRQHRSMQHSGLHVITSSGGHPSPAPRSSCGLCLCLNRDLPSTHSRPRPSGSASAKAKYDVASLRKQAAEPLSLVEVARVSTLHSSVLDYLVKLSNERYAVLASWPDFTTAVSVVDVNWLREWEGLERMMGMHQQPVQ